MVTRRSETQAAYYKRLLAQGYRRITAYFPPETVKLIDELTKGNETPSFAALVRRALVSEQRRREKNAIDSKRHKARKAR